MKYQYYIADVFTDQVFNGAQIAVFPNAQGLVPEKMALIAKELNLSETVFVSRQADTEKPLRMRVFSPFGEINFAGHPLIAAAYVLAIAGELTISEPLTTVQFEQNVGVIEANISFKDGLPSLVQFSRSVSSIIDRFAPSDEELCRFLGLNAADLDHKKYSPRLVSCGYPYLVVPVWNYEAVRKARFNYAAWSQSAAPQTAAQEILLFAPKSSSPAADFNVRLLGPNIGMHDDPPVGSAMPAFCCYLCSFEHTRKGTQVFAVERGDPGNRRSLIHLEMDNKGLENLTIRVGGQAVLFAEGTVLMLD